MRELPRGWVNAEIGEVSDYLQRGKSPQYTTQSDLPVINQKFVGWWGIDETHLKYVHPDQWESWAEERFLRNGDILWNSTGTGTIGRAAVFRGLQNTHRAVVDIDLGCSIRQCCRRQVQNLRRHFSWPAAFSTTRARGHEASVGAFTN